MEFISQTSRIQNDDGFPNPHSLTSISMVLIFHILKVILVEKLNCNGLSSKFMFVLSEIRIVHMDFMLNKNHAESVRFCLFLLGLCLWILVKLIFCNTYVLFDKKLLRILCDIFSRFERLMVWIIFFRNFKS